MSSSLNKPSRLVNSKSSAQTIAREAIAIVGLAGRYPQAENLREFWENLRQGRDCITEIPPERWDYRHYFDKDKNAAGKSYSKWAGFMADVDKFDPLFFHISPHEAAMLDPQERLFLETVWAAVEDAGYSRSTLAKVRQIGVFVGVMNVDYSRISTEAWANGSDHDERAYLWSIANRVSYIFDWRGPSLVVDTACAASLTAIHLACASIKRGECKLAVAGGVNLILHPQQHVIESKMKMHSTQGRCRPFAQDADGIVDGEGVGAVLLRPLADAVEAGDHIYGIIKGSGINTDGRTASYMVPSFEAQAALIRTVLTAADIDARTISYVEAHGTGTVIGDPVEIRGLTEAFGADQIESQTCAIGSVKSNIGHLESAAGIASLTKVLLQMKYQQLVPSLHAENLNPRIDFGATPFKVQGTLAEWKRPVVEIDGEVKEYPRRAGISSFGAGGANAHLVVEEYEGVERQSGPADPSVAKLQGNSDSEQPQVIVLSAKNEERLREYAHRLLVYLEQASAPNPGRQESDATVGSPTIQHTLCEMVAELLSIDIIELEVEQSFAECGLDAVQLSRLQTMVEERYGCELPRMLFAAGTMVKDVAQRISALTSAVADGEHRQQAPLQKGLCLASMAYTLQVGREAMEERLAIVVSRIDELIELLRKYKQKANAIGPVYRGNIKASQETIGMLVEGTAGEAYIKVVVDNREYDKVAQLWVSGVEIDWQLGS